MNFCSQLVVAGTSCIVALHVLFSFVGLTSIVKLHIYFGTDSEHIDVNHAQHIPLVQSE